VNRHDPKSEINSQFRASAPANALLVMAPYRHTGARAFDDPQAVFVPEPFVASVPAMID
jgi:hypothetical protein